LEALAVQHAVAEGRAAAHSEKAGWDRLSAMEPGEVG